MRKTILMGLFVIFVQFTQAQKRGEAQMNDFVSRLMKKMTLDEKIGQLNLVTPGGGVATGAVVSKGVEENIRQGSVGGIFGIYGADKIRKAQDLAVKNSRLHIPLLFGLDVIHGHKTMFPIPLGLSCSWDTALIEQSARIAATEASADGLKWVYSPMVDIARDPRWGRISEGSGEDPYLGSLIAKAMVRGYQGRDLRDTTSVMACVKHFALYGAAEAGREYNTADMSRLTMYQFYLPPYRAAVEAGAGSVMSSFNVVDGIPATGNKWLLTDLLRKQWGFQGFVVSDYTSLSEMTAHGMGDFKAVTELALKAGLDMDMVSEGFLKNLSAALKTRTISLSDIEKACKRILEAKYKLGLFDNPYAGLSQERASKEIMTPAHREAAKQTAERSMVLLKNANQLLPLKKSGTIALVGPLADNHRNMLGTWTIAGDYNQGITVAQGIKNIVGSDVQVLYARGANITDDEFFAKRTNALGVEVEKDPRTPEEMLQEAVAAAGKADVVVAVVGEAADMSGESSSRSDINIPESQKNLLKALVQTGKPVVLVLFNGRPLTLQWENEHITAILETWFGGTEAGNAIAEVLFGLNNPSGKLTTTFPRTVGQIPLYYNHKNTGRPFSGEPDGAKFKSDYLDIPNDPVFPFGFGLSYTSFSYSDIVLTKATMGRGQTIEAQVTLSNTGNYDGQETVQLYLQDVYASVSQPVKALKKFQKIFLRKGEKKEVHFTINEEDLKFYNSDLKWVSEPGPFNLFIGSNSNDVKKASFTLLSNK
ncbi:MAG: beta-glucosidase BglX [Flavisolibacter sp.]